MTGDTAIAPVIPLIYRAATEPGSWPEALGMAAKLLGTASLWLQCKTPLEGDIRIVASFGIPAVVVETYNRGDPTDDELVKETLRRPLKMVISTRVVFREEDFHRSRVHRELLQPAGLVEAAGAAFLKERDLYAALWMARRADSPPFTEESRQFLRELFPHMDQAMTVHCRLLRAERLSGVMAGALDRLSTGVVLMDARACPLLINREAARISKSNDGFTILEDGLAAATHAHTTMLRKLVRQAGAADREVDRPAGSALRLPRPSGRADYQIVVLPLPRRCQPSDAGSIMAVVFVTDPERSHTPIGHLIRDLFGLTEAEVRLVMELLPGKSLTEAAKSLGLSRNTVHSQLSAVFRKTGTGRQGELLRLVLRAIAPVKGPDDSSGFHVPLSESPGGSSSSF
ncbi:MAG: helix-turn-helix transcriptional regulator [Acidobacteria bacterium]|nr:helix-turn-helix transcriptional regulator [Acidobacteriota bacterium]